MEIVVLGTKNYTDQSKNYGDCILTAVYNFLNK